jgi:hypothetical protein
VAKILGKGSAKVNLPNPQGTFDGEAESESEALLAVQGGHFLEIKASAEFKGKIADNDIGWVQYLQLKLVK